VDGGKITLQDGKVVLIDANTVFAGDPDTNNQVSKDIAVGNFIQGFTKDNPDAATVTAAIVYINRVPETKGGKIAINFEGTVADVSGDRITLEDGKVIITTADTVITDAESSSDVVIQKGDYIQGYTEGNPDAKEITASRIHRCTF
jgi:hypothetical protein